MDLCGSATELCGNIFGKHLRITIKTNNINLLLWVITCFLCVLSISQYGRLKVYILKILKKFSYGFEDCLNKATSPFGFSEEQESRILRIFKFWGLNERIGEYKKLVKERNNIAHSNGNIYYKEQASVDVRISDVLRFAEEIHQKTKASIEQA